MVHAFRGNRNMHPLFGVGVYELDPLDTFAHGLACADGVPVLGNAPEKQGETAQGPKHRGKRSTTAGIPLGGAVRVSGNTRGASAGTRRMAVSGSGAWRCLQSLQSKTRTRNDKSGAAYPCSTAFGDKSSADGTSLRCVGTLLFNRYPRPLRHSSPRERRQQQRHSTDQKNQALVLGPTHRDPYPKARHELWQDDR